MDRRDFLLEEYRSNQQEILLRLEQTHKVIRFQLILIGVLIWYSLTQEVKIAGMRETSFLFFIPIVYYVMILVTLKLVNYTAEITHLNKYLSEKINEHLPQHDFQAKYRFSSHAYIRRFYSNGNSVSPRLSIREEIGLILVLAIIPVGSVYYAFQHLSAGILFTPFGLKIVIIFHLILHPVVFVYIICHQQKLRRIAKGKSPNCAIIVSVRLLLRKCKRLFGVTSNTKRSSSH